MSQSLLLDSSKDVLGTLDVGQAVVKLQGRIQKPFLISIPEFTIQKGRVTDEQIREYMKDKVSQLGTEDQTSENTAGEEGGFIENGPGSLLNGLEIAFLQDVVDYPDSGVAARYKHLGLSGRQGAETENEASGTRPD
jgi:hypothetical protein